MQLRQQQLGLIFENGKQIGVECEGGRGFDQRWQGTRGLGLGQDRVGRPRGRCHVGQPKQQVGGGVAQNTGSKLVQDALHLLHRLGQQRMRLEHRMGGS